MSNISYGPWPVCLPTVTATTPIEFAFDVMSKFAGENLDMAKHAAAEGCQAINTLVKGVVGRYFSDSSPLKNAVSMSKTLCKQEDELVPSLSRQAVTFFYDAYQTCIPDSVQSGLTRSYEAFQSNATRLHGSQGFGHSCSASTTCTPEPFFPTAPVPNTPVSVYQEAGQWYARVCQLDMSEMGASLLQMAANGVETVKKTCETFTVSAGKFMQVTHTGLYTPENIRVVSEETVPMSSLISKETKALIECVQQTGADLQGCFKEITNRFHPIPTDHYPIHPTIAVVALLAIALVPPALYFWPTGQTENNLEDLREYHVRRNERFVLADTQKRFTADVYVK